MCENLIIYLTKKLESTKILIFQDGYLHVLVIAQMILFSSSLDVQDVDKKRVEAVHLSYVLLLQRYLKYRCPKDVNKKLADILMLQQPSSELYDLHMMRLPI